MANSYTNLYIHTVFAVNGRQNLLKKSWRSDVFKYISGIITSKGHKSIIVNGVEDHIHIFIGYNPNFSLVDLIRDVKSNSTTFIKNNKFLPGNFSWQIGYSAFSHSHSKIERVYDYIYNQEEHHRKITFRKEFMKFLRDNEMVYQDKYLFEFYDVLCE